jgi:hypothetical protein
MKQWTIHHEVEKTHSLIDDTPSSNTAIHGAAARIAADAATIHIDCAGFIVAP